MELLPQVIRKQLPGLYSQEQRADPLVYVKYFLPYTDWYWYATEFDGEDVFFGWVYGYWPELGYFSLAELTQVRGPFGLSVERDVAFRPIPLSQVKKQHER